MSRVTTMITTVFFIGFGAGAVVGAGLITLLSTLEILS